MRLIVLTLLSNLLFANVSLANDTKSAFDAAEADKRISRIEDAVDEVQKQVNSLVINMPSSGGHSGGGKSEDGGGGAAATFTQLEDIRQQIRSIRGDLEQVQFDSARLNEKMVKFAADVEYRFNEIKKSKEISKEEEHKLSDIDEQLDNSVIQKETDAKPKSLTKQLEKTADKITDAADKAKKEDAIKQSLEDKYNEAYSYLKAKNYKTARELFQKFVNDNPDNELVGSAYFWLGETHFQRAEFDKAATQYLKGYQSNIRGSRAPDNLLKLAKSLSKLDKRKEACISLSKLKKEFPNSSSSVKKQLQDDMKDLRCPS